MKVGIVTFHRAHNCGAALQCVALKTVIERLGHNVCVVDCNTIGEGGLFPNVLKVRIWLGWIRALVKTLAESQRFWFRYNRFMRRFVPLTGKVRIGARFPESIDCFVLGSDQVLNPFLTHRYLETFLMRGRCEDAKKIAYAASFGLSSLPLEQRPLYKECLSRFRMLGIRETSGVRICREELGLTNDVALTIDPTLLLNAEDYVQFEKRVNVVGGYVLVYWIGASKDSVLAIAHRVASLYNLRVIVASITTSHESDEWRPTDPGEFLYLVRHARFVVATSFHATAFSIVNHKPFITIKPTGMKVADRLSGLLSQLGLLNHLVDEKVYLDDAGITQLTSIDYEMVDKILSGIRKSSLDYLRAAINSEMLLRLNRNTIEANL